MGPLLQVGVVNALAAGLLGLAAVAAGRWSRRPALVHALWVLALLKLVTPPLVALPLLAPEPAPVSRPVLPAPPERTVALVSNPAPVIPEPPKRFQNLKDLSAAARKGELPLPPSEQAPEPMPASPAPPLRAPAPEPPPPPKAVAAPLPEPADSWLPPGLLTVLAVVWLTGAAAWFALTTRRIAYFHDLLRCATPAPDGLQDEARVLARRLGLGRCPDVWLLPGPVPPLIWAVGGRACLYFPRDLLRHLTPESRAALLIHELAHLRRRDHWVRALEWLATGLYWWYPLVWIGSRRLHAAEEECCDAWVVGEMPEVGTAYAGALLETVDFLAETSAAPVLPPAASAFGRTYSLKRRLTFIVGGGPPRGLSPLGRLLLVGLALLLLPLGLTRARPVPAAVPAIPAAGQPAAPRIPAAGEPLTYESRPLTLHGGDDQPAGPETVFSLLCMACSPDGKTLAAGGDEKTVLLLDADTGKVLHPLPGHEDAVSGVAFSPDGQTLATASFDHTVRLWDVASGGERAVLAGHENWVFAVAFSPDGRTLASAGYDKVVRLWDSETGREKERLAGHRGGVRCLAFAPDGRSLATGSADRTVRVWDLAVGQTVLSFKGHEDVVRTVAFAPDGRTVVSGGEDNTLRLWDVFSGRQIGEHRQGDTVLSAAFAPAGRCLVSAGADNGVRVLDPASVGPRGQLRGHTDAVTAVAVSPDGRFVYTAGLDRTVRRWPAALPGGHPAADGATPSR